VEKGGGEREKKKRGKDRWREKRRENEKEGGEQIRKD